MKILPLMPNRSLRSMPGLAREGTDQKGPVAALERLVGIVGHDHVLQRGEAAVVQLHGHALKDVHGLQSLAAGVFGDLQQLQDHFFVGPEDLAGSQSAEHCIGDLSRRAGYRYPNRFCHGSFSREENGSRRNA